jgi:GT2 family glycosyltransferase
MQRNVARHVHPGEGQPLSEAHTATVETDFAPACAVMFRRKALEQVGLFDEALFTNWEDYDLCCRFQDAGWKLLTVGSAEVIHAHGQTTGRISPFITYFFTRNRLICLFRHGKPLGILRQSPLLARSVYWQMRAYGFDNWPAHKALLKGLTSFVLGVRGEGGAPTDRRDRRKA